MFASTMQFELQKNCMLGMAGTPTPTSGSLCKSASGCEASDFDDSNIRRVAPSGDIINHEKNIKHQQ
jgi:hypothetical protein